MTTDRTIGGVSVGRARWNSFRGRLARRLLGPEMWNRLDRQSEAIRRLEERVVGGVGGVPAAGGTAQALPGLEWLRGAEQHLAALQQEIDRLRSDDRGVVVQPILEWIRNAESHLAALQDDHLRLRDFHSRLVEQIERLIARSASTEARTADLERVATEIVLTIARRRAGEIHR